MDEEDKRDFAESLVEVLQLYKVEVETSTLRLWYTVLERYPLQKIQAALIEYIGDPDLCRFAPQPGNIVGILKGDLRRAPTPPKLKVLN